MSNRVSIASILACLTLGLCIAFAGSKGSILISGYSLFVICGAISFLLHWIIFIPSYIYQTEHYFDITGSVSYLAVLAIAIFFTKPDIDIRSLLICFLISVWAVRLGLFLFLRVKKDGKDSRFNIMKSKFWWYLSTWTIGGLWVFITICPALAAITSKVSIPLSWPGYLGLTMWMIGFCIEVVADSQKTSFNLKEENENKFITNGLWSWSRHPNYFGEILLWLGITIISFPVLSGLQLVTLISPIFVYLLLTKISGIPLLERKADKRWSKDPEYVKFKEITPVLFLKKP
ncbi:MAG: hypothetical protein CMD42_02660 [Gammaproteobacteria bacterium]|mgnify:FL=1|nr:hypothetical protein [Gammaproteobacteria bacterium]|tara:strand:- start:337 stop:1203 length:867 start_codon:yes stop_codon:yes gene_type:complete